MKKKLCKTPTQMCMPTEDNDGMGLQLAHAYVPWQCYNTAFSPREALMKGTLFPELYGPYVLPN